MRVVGDDDVTISTDEGLDDKGVQNPLPVAAILTESFSQMVWSGPAPVQVPDPDLTESHT